MAGSTLPRVLRPCYAMSSTEIGWGPPHLYLALRVCYALSGTEIGYVATRLQSYYAGVNRRR
eukprot:878220-Rhodomonas_salina.3